VTDPPSGADPVVELACSAHTYPDGTVGLHDVTFEVRRDETVALVGGNGAGKSTLLEHLNATLVPDRGELVVDGTPISEDNVALARSTVGFVFQDADTQLVAPTVVDDVMFGPLNDGVPPTAARERALDALAAVDAGHLSDRVPHHLSGGEKRLVGIAGVLVLNPEVVVLDEPFAGLDPERRRLVVDAIDRIRAAGASVVVSTHDLDTAAALADRVVVVADGDVAASGTPREVFYDADLLDAAGLHPPTAVRVARRTGLNDDDNRPVTEADLVAALDGDGHGGPTVDEPPAR
jgi:cobalt/nickel transport system ATP-binding protein